MTTSTPTSWTLSGEDALLLGAELADARTLRRVSIEGFTKDSQRSADWYRAVEYGELAITEAMAEAYAATLLDAAPAAGVVDVHSAAHRILTEPLGERSNDLRRMVGLRRLVTDSHNAVDASPEMVGQRDRLLVLQPWLLLAAVVAAIATVTELTLRWSDRGGTLGWVAGVQSALIPLGLLGSAVAALGIRSAGRLLELGSQPFRTSAFDAAQDGMKEVFAENGITWSGQDGWEFDEVKGYLLPLQRERLVAAQCRMTICQRCALSLTIGIPVALAANIVVAWHVGTAWAWVIPPALLAASLVAAMVGFWNEAARSATDVRAAVARGFGYVFEAKDSTVRGRWRTASKAKRATEVPSPDPGDPAE